MQTDQGTRAVRPPRYQAPRFRLDAEQGWFVEGPRCIMQLGPVKVYRKNGTAKTVTIKRLGEPVERRGGFVYVAGYLRE
ncbi:hypothetical protein [Pseudarthrobacter phenanthrenivorans]|uniref:Uncharacterized protein n=1 Tax=Pseudarthrobacter phenanthrenivorans TaxID=361575 RepID=A0A0B4DPT6_PSEPS|nr:hypothetical protein [Pseudarthrobacter phenanthrenivorans]KIC68706.1 hypothetical protein RM50_04395 [Pseudarthrobacter phenanthrenivorans]